MTPLEKALQAATCVDNFNWERYGETVSEATPHLERLHKSLWDCWEALVAEVEPGWPQQFDEAAREAVKRVGLTVRYQLNLDLLSERARRFLLQLPG